MKAKQIHEERGQRTFALVFDTGDGVVSGLTDFAGGHGLDAASFTAIGAFGTATLGYSDLENKECESIPVHEQYEAPSFLGNVAPTEDGEPRVHAHAVLGASDGSTLGGHVRRSRAGGPRAPDARGRPRRVARTPATQGGFGDRLAPDLCGRMRTRRPGALGEGNRGSCG